MTSDTFFIERVYADSTLKDTSEYYLVDFFDDETALKILKGTVFHMKMLNTSSSGSVAFPGCLKGLSEMEKNTSKDFTRV